MRFILNRRSIIIIVVVFGLAGPLIYILADLTVSMLAGTVAGLTCAFIVDRLKITVDTSEEAERLSQLPVLGAVPYIASEAEEDREVQPAEYLWAVMGDLVIKAFYFLSYNKEGKAVGGNGAVVSWRNLPKAALIRHRLIWNGRATEPVLDAYRVLSRNILAPEISIDSEALGTADSGGQIMAISATGPQDGATLTTINLAMTMAGQGNRILLLDMNMRQPSFHRIFGLELENGLSDMLVGIKKLDECVYKAVEIEFDGKSDIGGRENLHIMTAGTLTPNSPELLASGLSGFLSRIRREYRCILCDCSRSDTPLIASQTDFMVLVCRAGQTHKGALLDAKEKLLAESAHIKGLVLNSSLL